MYVSSRLSRYCTRDTDPSRFVNFPSLMYSSSYSSSHSASNATALTRLKSTSDMESSAISVIMPFVFSFTHALISETWESEQKSSVYNDCQDPVFFRYSGLSESRMSFLTKSALAAVTDPPPLCSPFSSTTLCSSEH